MTVKQFIRQFHLILALSVGLVFAVAGLTGSVLVFDHAIDEALNSKIIFVHENKNQPRLSYQSLLKNAKQAVGEEYYISAVIAPRHPESSQMFWYKSHDENDERLREIYLNPYTGAVLGTRIWGEYFTTFLYSLHYTLLLGDTGKNIMGAVGMGSLILLCSGLYLWWPRLGKRRWKTALSMKLKGAAKSQKRHYDWHRLSGIYSSLFLIILVISGTAMEWKKPFSVLVGTILPVSKTGPSVLEEGRVGRITVDRAIAIAGSQFPDSQFDRVYFPHDPSEPWRLTFTPPHDPKVENGYNRLAIDPVSGKILSYQDWNEAKSGDALVHWMFPLHSGEALGIIGRMIVFLSGLMPTILCVTGIIWWLRPAGRKPKPVTRR